MKIRNLRVQNQFIFNERNHFWLFVVFKISLILQNCLFTEVIIEKFPWPKIVISSVIISISSPLSFGFPFDQSLADWTRLHQGQSRKFSLWLGSTRTRSSGSVKVPDRSKRRRDEWDMGSNLSRQSERKEERREDFAVYDAQNYRKICEKYMLVKYIETNFRFKVGKFWKIFPKNGWFSVMSVGNGFSKNTLEDKVEFTLFPVWVKSCRLFFF